MKKSNKGYSDRRGFIKTSAGIISGMAFIPHVGAGEIFTPADSIHIIGPVAGYSPQVGTLVSMLNWMQDSLLNVTKGLTQAELDYLHDKKANSIGAMLMHIAAIEVIYQDMTFYGHKALSESNEKKWSVAMDLGEAAQKQIKGKSLDYYLGSLKEVRDQTLAELKKKDDQWLAAVDPTFFDGQPTNNYCKWFHVCEHIGNHRGQITWIRKRLPGAKAGKD
jgi:uncharacterized damage-inducible protein DinB